MMKGEEGKSAQQRERIRVKGSGVNRLKKYGSYSIRQQDLKRDSRRQKTWKDQAGIQKLANAGIEDRRRHPE